ncbi:AMP-binding protein [Umezawaea sp.]|uniref:AMP-binding protein n=1 Tax=Umezawaea sp. TaxID=1955258 RepID=UPI002ED04822
MLDVVNAIALQRNTDTRHRFHHAHEGELRSLSLAEVDARATAVALRLRELGIGRRDRVGIMARNSREWVLLDIAVLKLGAVTAGFEPGRFDSEEVVRDFGLSALFTDSPDADGRVVLDIAVIADWAGDGAESEPLHTGYDAADICAIKFTSGSTGMPKGLEATVASVNSALDATQDMFAHGDGDNLLVFLGNWFLQQRYWIYSALVFGHDVTLASVDDVLDVAPLAAPTVVMGVPGFYEDVKTRIEATGATPGTEVIQKWLGGRIRYLWTGSAPASRAVLEFFNDNGVPLYEGYGLNETCIVSKNHPGAFRLGSVGRVLPGKRVRFDQDGVLIVGSTHPINTRYTWSAPGVNEKTFLPTGEVKTYDVGYVDDDGFLFVQGRVDDVIALGTGYNVLAPMIEHLVREHPAVHECVLHGSGRQFLSAVVSPASPDVDEADLRRFVRSLNEGLLEEQRVQAVVLAAERFSIENGMLTGQFKPRRKDIHTRYAAELESIYAGALPDDVPLLVTEQVKEHA